METKFENEIVLDQFGNVNVEYYEAKAQQLRSEAISEMLTKLGQSLSKLSRIAFLPQQKNA